MIESHFWVLVCFSEMTSTKPIAALPSCCTRTRALPQAVRKHLKCWCRLAQHFSSDAAETAHRLDLCDQTFVWCLRPFAFRQDLFWSSFECQGWSPALLCFIRDFWSVWRDRRIRVKVLLFYWDVCAPFGGRVQGFRVMTTSIFWVCKSSSQIVFSFNERWQDSLCLHVHVHPCTHTNARTHTYYACDQSDGRLVISGSWVRGSIGLKMWKESASCWNESG